MSALQRLPDWPLRFDALVSERLHAPFRWGAHDCALFAADAVLAITGRDLAAGLRGLGARQALAHVRRAGGMAALVPPELPELPSPALAQEGDVVLLSGFAPKGRRLGFGVMGSAILVLVVTRDGLLGVPRGLAQRAWGVGHG